MNTHELNKLREIDYSRGLSAIEREIHGKDKSTVIAVAYVLNVIASKPNINYTTMVEFFLTADLTRNRRFFIEGILETNWKPIKRLALTIEPDVLQAIILFYDSMTCTTVQFSTPTGVCQLAARLLDIAPGDSVIDLGSGSGNFLRECCFIQPEAKYTGIEIGTYSAEIAVIRAEILGKDIKIEQGNFLDINDEEQRYFDKAFSHYPWGSRIRSFSPDLSGTLQNLCKKMPPIQRAYSGDWWYNSLLVDVIKNNGKAVGIMPVPASFNKPDSEIRQHFVKNGWIETIILLPNEIFYPFTRIQTLMVVFSHGNKSVKMVDSSDLSVIKTRKEIIWDTDKIETILQRCKYDSEYSKSVTLEELQKSDYELNPALYMDLPKEIINGVPLKNLIKTVYRGAQISSSDLQDIFSEEPTDIEYLMLKDIQDGVITKILPYIQSTERYDKFLVKPNSLIFSKGTDPLKICVADIEPERKIVASGSLYILELDQEKINPYYLKAFFESPIGKISIERASTGSAIKIISLNKLKKIMIPMIPVEEQKKFEIEYRAIMDEIRVLRKRTERAVDRLDHLFETWQGGSGESA